MKKYFSICLALLPFLYQYKSPINVVSFGEFLLMPFLLFYCLCDVRRSKKINSKIFCGLYVYFSMAFFTSIIAGVQNYFSFSSFMTIAMRMFYYGILIYISSKYLDRELFVKTIKIASLLFALYGIAQYIVHFTTGRVLETVINKNWIFQAEAGKRLDYEIYYRWLYRPSSLFLEPSYFASYVCAGLALILMDGAVSMKKICLGLLITLSLILSSSSAGFAMFIIIWAMFAYDLLFKNKSSSKGKKILFIVIIFLTIMFVMTSNLATTLLERTSGGGSFNNRVVRTYLLLKEMNIFQVLFGVGINNVDSFVISKGFYTAFDESNLNYVSSVMGTFLCSGIFTFIAYIIYYIKSFKFRSTLASKTFVLMLFFKSLIGNNSFSHSFAFYAILIIISFRQNIYQKEEF